MRALALTGLLALFSPEIAAACQPLRGTVVAADGTPAAGATVWAAQFTYCPYPRVAPTPAAKADTELDVTVPRAGRIVGRVTDAAGNPVPGAVVGRHTSGSYFSINGLFVNCDADGRFEYDDAVPADQPTRLTASAPGYTD